MACTRAVLVLALVLSAAVAGTAQDAAAGKATSADQPQQAEGAAAVATDHPAAGSASNDQPANAAAKPVVEESTSTGDGAADPQPQPQADLPAADGDPGADGQAQASKRVFTAEQLAELQQQIQHAIDLQRNHEQVGTHAAAASPCITMCKIGPVTTTGATLPAAPVVQVSEPLVVQIVDEAPAAELANGDADVSTTGELAYAAVV